MAGRPAQRRRDAPELVRRAVERGRQIGFDRSCRPQTGRLLQLLAANVVNGRILELGTGAGCGTAWLAHGLRREAGARLITIDNDETLAGVVAQLFGAWPEVDVLTGDWREALDRAPFELIFVDVSDAKSAGLDAIVGALARGGLVLLDDLTPVERWPDEWRGQPDPVRDAWLHHPDLIGTEIRVAADHAVILGVRR